MFESLSDRLSQVFKSFGGQRELNEENIQQGLREVRLALLEADVNFKVVKGFVDNVREKCLGQAVLKGVSPAQQVVKIVHDELVELLGGAGGEQESRIGGLNLTGAQPAVIMLVGLQGSGKTTSAGKIANLLRKQKMRPYLIPADVYRPAAIDQLVVLAKQLDMPFYPSTTEMNPVDIARAAIADAREKQATVALLDTAGRLHVDDALMQELENIKAAVNPQEILFVADAMTGQDAVTVAEAFNARLGITGVVLTKMDGDARGGAALSIKSVTGASVRFVGMGEKLSEMEVFHPDRVAGRILGMGDVLTLMEKAQSTMDAEEAEAMARKMQKAQFDLEDFRTQMRRVKQMGSLDTILKLIPGLGGLREKLAEASGALPEKELARTEAIINSMTMAERRNPDVLNGSRRARIAKGAGVSVQQVNQLVRQFEQMRQMMKGMMGGGAPKMPRMPRGMGNMPRIPRIGGSMPRLPGGPGGFGGLGGMGGDGLFGGMGNGLGDMPGMGLPGGDMPRPAGSFTKKKKKRDKKKKKK